MKKKSEFQTWKRPDRLIKGKPSIWVRFRDRNGELLGWVPSGVTSVSSARTWAFDQIKKSPPTRAIRFEDYAKDFFNWETSAWIKRTHDDGHSFGRSFAAMRHGHVENYLIPKWGKYALTEIDNPIAVKDWLISLQLSNQTKNHILYSFRIIMKQARDERLISWNPVAEVNPSGDDSKSRDIFQLTELARLFPAKKADCIEIWETLERAAAFAILASTGIRSGECRGLAWRHLLPGGALLIERAVKQGGELGPTKTGDVKAVLVPVKTVTLLRWWRKQTRWSEKDDLMFTEDGKHPHAGSWFSRAFPEALKEAKITIDGRNLTPHCFRRTFITHCRALLPEETLRRLTGHRSAALEGYDHPAAADLVKRVSGARPLIKGIIG